MSDITNTITNTRPNMPFHFIPQMADYLSDQIRAASQALAKVDLDAARNKALQKFKEQSEKNLSDPQKVTSDASVANFLTSNIRVTEQFKTLQAGYIKLPTLYTEQPPTTQLPLTTYVSTAQKAIENINKEFDDYLRNEKKAFHEAYADACPDEGKRKELWEMYAKNLRTNMQVPLEKFTKDIDGLVSQALIFYVNRLGKVKKDPSDIGRVEEWTKENLERKLHYIDSNKKPITITRSKETGEVTELRLDPMSSLFGHSGNIGDAHAILAAYHGKDVPIRITLPLFEDDEICINMKDLIALLIFLAFSQLYQYLEKNDYLKEAKNAGIDKGISLDNIILVDGRNRPIMFSDKDKAEVVKKLQEKERAHFAKENKSSQELERKRRAAEEETQQPQQPSLSPAPAA